MLHVIHRLMYIQNVSYLRGHCIEEHNRVYGDIQYINMAYNYVFI